MKDFSNYSNPEKSFFHMEFPASSSFKLWEFRRSASNGEADVTLSLGVSQILGALDVTKDEVVYARRLGGCFHLVAYGHSAIGREKRFPKRVLDRTSLIDSLKEVDHVRMRVITKYQAPEWIDHLVQTHKNFGERIIQPGEILTAGRFFGKSKYASLDIDWPIREALSLDFKIQEVGVPSTYSVLFYLREGGPAYKHVVQPLPVAPLLSDKKSAGTWGNASSASSSTTGPATNVSVNTSPSSASPPPVPTPVKVLPVSMPTQSSKKTSPEEVSSSQSPAEESDE